MQKSNISAKMVIRFRGPYCHGDEAALFCDNGPKIMIKK